MPSYNTMIQTWADCRSPIYAYPQPTGFFDAEIYSPNTNVFRVAQKLTNIFEVTDQPVTWFMGIGGLIAQCFVGYPPTSTANIKVGTWNVGPNNDYDPSGMYFPNFLDEEDVPYWDGATFETSVGTYTLSQEAVDGDDVDQNVGSASPPGYATVISITGL